MARTDTNQDETLAYVASEFQNLQYLDGTEWINVPGIEGSSLDGTASPSREIIGANTASQQRVGRPRVGTLTFEANAVPHDPAWRFLRNANQDGTLVQFRYETNGETTFTSPDSTGATIAIDASGACTLVDGSGQEAPVVDGDFGIGRGAVIDVGDKLYIITEVSPTTNAITVANLPDYATTIPAAKVISSATDDWAIYNPPGLRWSFRAYVAQGTDFSLTSESHMTTSLVLVPKHRISNPTIIV